MKSKRNNIIHFFKLSIFIFTVSLVLWNCNNDLDTVLTKQEVQQNYTIAHKNFDFIVKNTSLLPQLNALSGVEENLLSKKDPTIKINNYVIFTDRVTYIAPKNGLKESYSFYIERLGVKEPNKVENLILSKNLQTNEFKCHIITYVFPKETSEKEAFKVIDFKEVDNENLQVLNAKGCENTYEYAVVETKHDCYTGEHSGASEEGSCNYASNGGTAPYSTWSIHVTVNYQCDGGETGSGSGTSDPRVDYGGGGATDPNPENPNEVDTGITLPSNCQEVNCTGEITANTINELLGNTLTAEQLLWLFYHDIEADTIKKFLLENNITEAKIFVKQAIKALANGGEVDFDDRIINNLTGKAKCVYEKLLSSGISNYHNMITDLFIEFGDNNIGGRDLTFKISSDLPKNVAGKTEIDSNGNYRILINQNLNTNYSSIEIAGIIVHEIAHAFLAKHYYNSNTSFSDLYQEYINDTGIQNYSHDIMRDQFINRIATVLKNYDNSIFSNFDDYKILASYAVFDLTDSQKQHLINVKNNARQNDNTCN